MNQIEGTFHKYDDRKAAAVAGWLERHDFSKEDVLAAIDLLVEREAAHPPNPGELLGLLQELDLVPYSTPGFADPRLIGDHQKTIRDQAITIARLRGISFRQAVEGIRDEQRAWLDEGIRMDYLSESERGWHRDRIEACVQLLSSREPATEATTLV
jgi:hypothetical protein